MFSLQGFCANAPIVLLPRKPPLKGIPRLGLVQHLQAKRQLMKDATEEGGSKKHDMGVDGGRGP